VGRLESQVHQKRLPAAPVAQKPDRFVRDGAARLTRIALPLLVHVLVRVEQGLDRRRGVAALAMVVGVIPGGAEARGQVGLARRGSPAEAEVGAPG